jgi:hypothetical protein
VAVSSNESPSFLPADLRYKCFALVQSSHKAHGFGDLPKRLVTRDNLVILGCQPDMLVIMQASSAAFKLRIICWMVAVGLAVAALFFSWWLLCGLVLVFVADRWLAVSDRKNWLVLSANLLALEMLANDFEGWGRAFPGESERALQLLRTGTKAPCDWLDYYLPRRNKIDPASLRAFGPAE